MALTCGVSLNLNNLKGDVEARAAALLNINMGTPAGLAEFAGKIEGELSAIANKVAAVVVIPPVLKTLRDELAELAALPFAGLAAAGKILSIAAEYADALGLSGYANLNLTDLAKSVFSITGTFDPCSATIPNIALSDGEIMKLPAIQPLLGSTLAALKVEAPDRQIVDNLAAAVKNNTPVVSSASLSSLNAALESGASTIAANAPAITATVQKEVASAKTAITENVSTAITGMGNALRKLPTGEQVVESRDFFIKRIKQERSNLLLEV